MRSMRIHHLNCGTMCPLALPSLVCHCLLIETVEGLVLVESGLGLDDVRHTRKRMGRMLPWLTRPRLDEAECALNQVRALGFDPRDVQHIVLTHLDFDHVGGVSDFPWATVHVTRDEWQGGFEQPTAFDRDRYSRLGWARDCRMEQYTPEGEPWFGFQCVRDLRGLPPEILLVPVPGHTRGHAAVAVKGKDRWLLHCGDAYFSRHEMQSPPSCPLPLRAFQRACFDNPQRLYNQQRLRELAHTRASEVTLLCAHDSEEYATLRDPG